MLVEIPYAPFTLTAAMHADPSRFKVICCGRQFGKTTFAMVEVSHQMNQARLESGQPARAIVVSPTYKLLYENWRTFLGIFGRLPGFILSSSLAEMRLTTLEGEIEFRSADSEAGVGRGGHYHIALFDEAARVPESVWQEEVRPALSDTHGGALLISTPWGKNWFYRAWMQAQELSGWKAWQYSTLEGWRSRYAADPGRLAQAEQEWEMLRATTPERTFQQEYEANFIEHEGQLWTLAKALRGQLHPAVYGKRYLAGVDVAHIEDWMATVVVEAESKQVVEIMRSRHHDWALQKAKVVACLRRYPDAHVLVDATGIGDPIAQELLNAGLDVEPLTFTVRLKQQLVENLTVALEQGYVGIPDQLETQWLLEELRNYQEFKVGAEGHRYGAPHGLHDDGVTALMLAVWGLRTELSIPSWEEAVPPSGWFLEASREYGTRVETWKQRYPHLSLPQHERDLAWLVAGMN